MYLFIHNKIRVQVHAVFSSLVVCMVTSFGCRSLGRIFYHTVDQMLHAFWSEGWQFWQ